MADERIAATKLTQHRGSYFTGEGTTGLGRHILSAPRNLGTGQQRLALGKIGERRADRQLRARRRSLDTLKQRRVGGQAAMHLPIADDQLLSHKGPLFKSNRLL